MNIKKNTGLKISLLSSDLAKIFSSGKILNSKTLNYKDFTPEEGGLFCEKIFGSIDKKCYCGKTISYHDFNFLCDYCGVETSLKSLNLRRTKLGYIKLNDYFLNSLYYKISPYYLSTILDISKSDINNLLYFDYYLIIYSSLKFIKTFDIVKSEIYFKNKNKNFYNIHGVSGIESIKYLLNDIDLFSELKKIKLDLKLCDNLIFKKKYIKRYKILRKFFNSNIKLTSILLKNILVLPPDLRPIVSLPDDTFVTSDLNELYKRVINSNLRLKKIKKYSYVPSFFLSNERKIIQENIDNLFLGGAKTNNNKKLKSLSENIKGKNGYFRKNLLGKRVDYSARAVIVSGAHLKMGECAIPKHLAFELFRPFIYSKILLNKDLNIKIAKFEVDKQTDYAFLILSKIIKNKYVILNRAPSLHRLNIQAFKILLTGDKAIKLHPLVCASYNADFDGDQMAIHIPITFRSSIEYKTLLFSNNNILYPSNGTCCISPTKDMILGIYYSSKLNHFDLNNNIFFFNNFDEVVTAYICNFINYNTIIYFRLKEFNNKINNFVYKIYKTNLCRIFIYKLFFNYPFFNLNKILKKSDICKIIDSLSINKNSNFIVSLSDQLMNIGFNFVTKSGFSISLDDMFFSYNKKNIFNISNNIFISHNLNYFNFMITKNSKKLKIFNLWDKTCNLLSNLIFKDLSFSNYVDNNNIFLKIDSFNFLYMMMDSGARGSESQILQICGSRGLINFKKSGIFETPVLSNLREGLSILEYFYFSYNSRKTLADTALKTSSAGYLTRRLVESSNNVFISEFDCGTTKGLNFKSLIKEGDIIKDFYDRIFGRVLLHDFIINDVILLKKNYLIDNNSIIILKKNNISNIYVRSPLKCISKIGMCSLCYGIDLSRNRIVDVGEMVGIVAAQSIGEPGTQLTMRTFHSGGAVNKRVGKSFFKSNSNGYLKFPSSFKTIKNSNNLEIVISEHNRLQIINDLREELESFFIPYSSYIFFKNNSYVKKGDIIGKWDSNYDFIISEYKGYIKFINFIKSFNYINRFEDNCIEIINNYNSPHISILDFNKKIVYNKNLCVGNIICYNDLDFVDIGDIIIKTPKKIIIAEDIIGGLPRIDNLFEARTPNNSAIISPFDGVVSYKDINGKKYIFISKNKKILFSKFINSENFLNFSDNQEVKKGDFLTSGPINPNDILFVYGVDYLVEFLLKEIKYIYFSQGVEINDKHIEIILNQMLKFGCITNPGKSNFLVGEILSINSIKKINKNFDKFSKIKYNIILLGITNKSLKIDSFLSAASFQRTEQILSDAAIRCSYDDMRLLKNVVMVGKIFESGSGIYDKILKR